MKRAGHTQFHSRSLPELYGIKFPGYSIRIFKGNVILLECWILFHPGIFNRMVSQGNGNPLEFGRIVTTQGDVIQANPERIELIALRNLSFWSFQGNSGITGKEDHQLRLVEYDLKT